MFLFLPIAKWKGLAYAKSEDPKMKQIGVIAFGIVVLSTIITSWLAVVWTQDAIQSSLNSINADMSA